VRGSGFRVQGSGFRVQGSGFKVQGSAFRVQGSGFSVQGSAFRVQGLGGLHVLVAIPCSLPHFSRSLENIRAALRELLSHVTFRLGCLGVVVVPVGTGPSGGSQKMWRQSRGSQLARISVFVFGVWVSILW
ncbi:hypothetical protein T484DRAFT_3649602, partial [Baffinella frigidus]